MNSSHTYKSRNKKSALAQGLGWFSVAIGAAELILPGGLASLIGVRKHRTLFRLLGLRELASGVGLLTQKRPTPWLWSRVAGDALDLALLGTALTSPKSKNSRIAAAAAAVAGVAVLDVIAARNHSRNGHHQGEEDSAMLLKKSVIIDRPPQELYHYWRNFENLPRFMYYLDLVTVHDSTRSHWVAKGPGDAPVEWDSEVTDDVPNERIAWRSLPGSVVENQGVVRFQIAPGGRGTMVTVEMAYRPPAGPIGAAVAKLFHREPKQQVQDSLRHFKQLMETGIVLTTKGQPAGRKSSTSAKFDYKTPELKHELATS